MAPGYPILLVVAAALIDGEGRVLLQQRAPHRSMPGLWEFPGGKVESGETPEAALARELEEELGVRVPAEAMAPIAFASDTLGERHLVLLLYGAREWAGEPQPLDASALRWVTVEEMHGLPMPPADVPLVAALERLVPLRA
jgi:8-oxo-dGTP diphosphatase